MFITGCHSCLQHLRTPGREKSPLEELGFMIGAIPKDIAEVSPNGTFKVGRFLITDSPLGLHSSSEENLVSLYCREDRFGIIVRYFD